MKKLICKIMGHSFGVTTLDQLFLTVWGNAQDKKEELKALTSKKCSVCGIVLGSLVGFVE